LHLAAAGLYESETVHSFRRGALQATEAAGLEVPSLLELGQLRSAVTLARYLDRFQHLGPRPVDEAPDKRPRLRGRPDRM
jgi:hypothetical protein